MQECGAGPPGPVIGVVGGSGGLGSSTLAACLALVAGRAGGLAVLVDLDPAGGGVDVLLGIESEPGARCSGLRLAGGWLDPEVLASGLPRAGPVLVLAADGEVPDAAALPHLLDAAAALGTVVLDLPRTPTPARQAALALCDLLVVLVRPDVAGAVAGHAVLGGLEGHSSGVVVCAGRRRRSDGIGISETAVLVGSRLLGTLPARRRRAPDLARGQVPRAQYRLAAGILAGLHEPLGSNPARATAVAGAR